MKKTSCRLGNSLGPWYTLSLCDSRISKFTLLNRKETSMVRARRVGRTWEPFQVWNMAKDIATLYQQRLKTQERGGGGAGGRGSKPSLFGLFLLFVLWFVLVLNVWKKLVRLVWALLHNNYKTVKGLNPGVISKVGWGYRPGERSPE